MATPAPCATLWIGPALGPVERACLKTVVAQGHPLTLYCYAEPAGVPDGVEVRDAAEVLPEALVVRHRGGSVSLFSNRFRYELQRRGAGIWIDADVYLVAPLPAGCPYLLGRHDDTGLSTAVLRLPPDSPMIDELVEPFEQRTVPPWLSRRARLAAWWRLRRTGSTQIGELPWGSLGPRALTWVARRHGVAHHALDPSVLSPVHWDDARWILDPSRALGDVLAPATVAVHLYNEMIKGFKDDPAPPGSFLARLHEEGATAPSSQRP